MMSLRIRDWIAIPFICLFVLMSAIHPFIHGTFIDGGAWDSALAHMQMLASYFSSTKE